MLDASHVAIKPVCTGNIFLPRHSLAVWTSTIRKQPRGAALFGSGSTRSGTSRSGADGIRPLPDLCSPLLELGSSVFLSRCIPRPITSEVFNCTGSQIVLDGRELPVSGGQAPRHGRCPSRPPGRFMKWCSTVIGISKLHH